MGKQQQNQITPRRSVFNDLGLEANGITYDQFSKKFDENEEFRKSVYNDLGFEGQGIDYDKFYTTMGKPTEVSVPGSAPTSQTSPEPIPSTENPELEQTGTNVYQQLQGGELLGQSLVEVGDYNQKIFIDDKSYDSAKNALIKISDYESGKTQLSDEQLSQYNKEYSDFLASKGGLPAVQTQGTWKEPFTGQWNFDTRGYEYFEPDENTLLNAGGWDNLAAYFKKDHPNVILTRTNIVDQGDGQAAVANTETVNEDTAKPAFNPIDYLRQQELNQIPIEQWSDKDKMDLWDSQIRQTNIEHGNMSEADVDAANRRAVAEADRKNDQESGYIFNTLSKLATLSEDAGMVAASTLANLLGVPEFGWDVVAEAVGAKSYRDVFGEDILLQGQRGLKEVVKRKEDYNAIRFGDAPIWEDFRDGRLNDGANKIASSLGQSLTYMAMLMSGNTGSMAAFLSGAEGEYLKLQQDNPDMDRGLKLLNSGLFSAAEIVPERIGLNSMMRPFYKLYQKEGVAIATGALEKSLRKYVGGLAVITPHVEEMSTEYATMLMQNAIAKYSGEDPNRSLIEGWQDTGITSLAMSGVLSGPSQIANSIVDSGRRRKVEGLLQQNFDIERAMQGYAENAPERVMMSTQYYRNLQMINGYIETQYEELGADGLSDKKKDAIRTFMEQRQRLMDLTASDNIPESVKEGAQEDIEAINDQITEVLKEEENVKEDEAGISSEERVREESVETESQQEGIGEEVAPSGNVQTSQTQEVNENIKVPSETPVENVQVAPVGEQVQGQGEVVAEKNIPDMTRAEIISERAEMESTGIGFENQNRYNALGKRLDSMPAETKSAPKEEVSVVSEQTPIQEEIVAPTQVNEPVSDKVNPKLKEVIKSVSNQDLNTLMGPANVEKRRDVIETVTGKRPSKNDAGIARVKQVVADYLGVTGNDSQKVQAIKNWANFERTEFSSPEEATRYAAENTIDPQEVLRMYDEQPQLDQSDKGIAIAQWLGDKGKINLSDFTRWGDRNNLTRDISSRRIDTGDNLMGLDAQLEADGLAAQGITPDDVVDFITNYKDEADYRDANKSETEKMLEDRYKALTGRNITPKALDRFRQQSATERANLVSEQEANQSLAEAGITQEELAAQQQMEAEQGREPRQESAGKTPKSLLKGIADRLSETGLAKSVKITDSKGVSKILGIDVSSNLSDRELLNKLTELKFIKRIC